MRGLSYLNENGEIQQWPERGVPADVNTDPARAVNAAVVAVEKSKSDRAGAFERGQKEGIDG